MLYIIRHGRTPLNKEHKYNCRFDEDINETGVLQAKEAAKQVEQLHLDLVICSPMKRTRHTMELINIKNVPVIFDDRLIERDCGKLTCTKIDPEFYNNEYFNYYSTAKVEGLESLPELFKRVHSLLDEIKEKYNDKNILLVTHGDVSKAINFYFNPLPDDGLINKFDIKNCEVYSYKFK